MEFSPKFCRARKITAATSAAITRPTRTTGHNFRPEAPVELAPLSRWSPEPAADGESDGVRVLGTGDCVTGAPAAAWEAELPKSCSWAIDISAVEALGSACFQM